ncbi:FAD binding domain-containing protein [Peribacillus deserti]|uniref:Xanthine dehydrogenase n=1 Tax=Peribacillus deserti TaxID=673318 RepID=A0A2N5M2D4_9BACI|nr:FAD binding domain-containing protein [Peribacillus deserti]PLT28511.1 xanthine dehydrogenase [Peribacillus deserti]
MIPTDFEYYLPATISEAVHLYRTLKNHGKKPLYYSGGTEIITFLRLHLIETGAVININAIPECRQNNLIGDSLTLGSSLTLTEIEEANVFPLLSAASAGVADHTSRNKITLGGNICGMIFYREAVLPFLLCDSYCMIAGGDGVRKAPINSLFNKSLQLTEGELLVQIITQKRYLDLPFICIKRRQQWETGYPLVTVAALRNGNEIRVAISGLCPFPFRSAKMEADLNNTKLSLEERIELAFRHLPAPILHDVEGSAEYRLFVLKNTLLEIIPKLEAGAIA